MIFCIPVRFLPLIPCPLLPLWEKGDFGRSDA
jgi:hypothetical protein